MPKTQTRKKTSRGEGGRHKSPPPARESAVRTKGTEAAAEEKKSKSIHPSPVSPGEETPSMRKTKNNAAVATKPAPSEAPAVAEVEGEGERAVDDDFEGEVPAIGATDTVAELETVEEEFEVDAPVADAEAVDDDDSLAPPKPKQPSDKE